MSVSPRVRDAIQHGPKPEPEAIPFHRELRAHELLVPDEVITDEDYRTPALWYTLIEERFDAVQEREAAEVPVREKARRR